MNLLANPLTIGQIATQTGHESCVDDILRFRRQRQFPELISCEMGDDPLWIDAMQEAARVLDLRRSQRT